MAKVREMKTEEGYNARTDKYENLTEAGVIDPAKVVRFAIQNARSIAGLLCSRPRPSWPRSPRRSRQPRAPGGPGGMGMDDY